MQVRTCVFCIPTIAQISDNISLFHPTSFSDAWSVCVFGSPISIISSWCIIVHMKVFVSVFILSFEIDGISPRFLGTRRKGDLAIYDSDERSHLGSRDICPNMRTSSPSRISETINIVSILSLYGKQYLLFRRI